MKKIFNHQLVKYLLVGFSTVCLDFIFLIFFKTFLFLSATLAVAVGQILIWLYNFTINKYWSFNNKKLPYKQFLYYLILALFNYCLAIIIMYFFSDKLGFNYLIVRFATIGLTTVWNFFIYKYWIYV